MRQCIGLILLVAQLSSFAGVGICVHAGMQPEAKCSAPMQGMPQDSHHGRSSDSQNCSQMFVCSTVTQIAPATNAQLIGTMSHGATNYSTPASLFPSDPIAPPQPPPIS